MSAPAEVAPRASARVDRWMAALLWLLAFVTLFLTEKPVGFVRDESVYFVAGGRFAQWWQLLWQKPSAALSDELITRAFEYNREHPMAMKSLFGLSRLLFTDTLHWVRPATGYRLPALAVAALIPALLHLFGSGLYGRRAGLFAAISFFLVPRQFFDAHLACFDVPIAAMWLLVVYTYWRSQTDRRFWLYTGLAFGLAIATKHNGFFLPFVIGPLALYRAVMLARGVPAAQTLVNRFIGLYVAVVGLIALLLVTLGLDAFKQGFEPLSPQSVVLLGLAVGTVLLLRQLARVDTGVFRALAPIGTMAILGPLIFFGHWPFLWYHPVERFAWYLNFHATHEHYAWMYLGTLLRQPPFPLEYVFVVTALTTPLSLMVPMGLGLWELLARTVRGVVPTFRANLPTQSEVLVGLNALASIFIISWPSVPHFGGTKHWYPSMCFLALLAGRVVVRGVDSLRARFPRLSQGTPAAALFTAVSTLLFFPAVVDVARVHPYGESSYTELAGGLPGAASLGMQRQFWSNNVTGVLPWINAHAPQGARVYLHEVRYESFLDYQSNGMLRADLQPARGGSLAEQINNSDVAAYQYHQEFREQEMNIWQAYGTTAPSFGLYLDETPQIMVYRRP